MDGHSAPLRWIRRGCKAEAQLEKSMGYGCRSQGKGSIRFRLSSHSCLGDTASFGVIGPCLLFDENGVSTAVCRERRKRLDMAPEIRNTQMTDKIQEIAEEAISWRLLVHVAPRFRQASLHSFSWNQTNGELAFPATKMSSPLGCLVLSLWLHGLANATTRLINGPHHLGHDSSVFRP